ncbi:MAG: protein kinase domain-containing protein [Blastocatellia bacterium]
MTPERHQQIGEIFRAAAELPSAERAAFLDRACAGDEALKREVVSLLDFRTQAEGFIEQPALEVAARMLAENQAETTGGVIESAPKGEMVGRVANHYRVIAPLGRGGMGEVYLAEDTRLGRKVALKLLPPQFTTQPERVRRFEQEARAASALNHPNIITIHEIAQAGDAYFIVTEFVEGQTLRQRLAGGKLELREALDIATQVASALAAAHVAGVVHRDIKPENLILRPDGLVKVLDFGLAKLTETQHSEFDTQVPTAARALTEPGRVRGTVRYMSPEQARGLEVDGRSDVFSLGVTLYETIAGRPPFAGTTTADVIAALLDKEPLPLSAVLSHVPDELQRIVSKALAKERAARYQTCDEMLAELQSLRREMEFEQQLKSRGSGAKSKAAGPSRKKLIAGLAALLLLIAVSAGYLLFGRRSAEKAESDATSATSAAVSAVAPRRSVAVLPFKPLVAAGQDEYLQMGMADVLITRLSNLHQVAVRPISAVRRYTGLEQDPIAAGRELKVEAVLDGSIQRVGDRVRVTARLINISDGAPLWAETFDEKFTDIFHVQDALSEKLAGALALKLTGGEQRRLARRDTTNHEAFQAYLKGRFFWSKWNNEGLKKSVEYFEQAIAADPNYALAHSGLADAWNRLGYHGIVPPREAFPKSEAAARQAIKLDDALGEAHLSLANTKFFYDWDFPGFERELKRALDLNPNYANAHGMNGTYLTAMGRFDEALAARKRALDLDPASPLLTVMVGWPYFYARRYDEAIQWYRKALELDPNFSQAYSDLGLSYHLTGRHDEAVAALLKARALNGAKPEVIEALRQAYVAEGFQGYWRKDLELLNEQLKQGRVRAWRMAGVYHALGDRDRTFEWLEKAYAERDSLLTFLKVMPQYEDLHADPRFAGLLRRVGLE